MFIFIQSSFLGDTNSLKMAYTIPPVQQYKYFDITINAERTLAGSKDYSCNKLTIKTAISNF